ncbi:MAG: 2-hydroxyacyl-CoA dehydratase [Candidatus Syntropharchaeia archaeon]
MGGVCARQGTILGYLEGAENFGFPRELCSVSKAGVGVALGKGAPPDVVLGSPPVCDGGMKGHDFMGDYFGCPSYLVDVPYMHDEDGVAYLAEELEEAANFISENTGVELDLERCKKEFVIEESKRRLKEGKVEEENFRILWSPLIPQAFLDIVEYVEREHGVKIVMEFINYRSVEERIDPSKPFESMARKTLQTRFASWGNGPGERMVDQHLDIIRDYDVDGVIYFAHWGCRTICGCLKMIKDAIMDEFDIPVLVLDGDIFDPRNNPKDQAKSRVEEFIELLE